MNQTVFNSYSKNLLSAAAKVRNSKMKEYLAEDDRLSNFRKAANLQGCSIPTAISGMMVKHTVSIFDMVDEEFGRFQVDPPYSSELWREKLIDQINYILLLYASIREERDE